tara:strand:- start:251 stop:757 length:507 start_codon:yes stop_codon:yes gene_type:complete
MDHFIKITFFILIAGIILQFYGFIINKFEAEIIGQGLVIFMYITQLLRYLMFGKIKSMILLLIISFIRLIGVGVAGYITWLKQKRKLYDKDEYMQEFKMSGFSTIILSMGIAMASWMYYKSDQVPKNTSAFFCKLAYIFIILGFSLTMISTAMEDYKKLKYNTLNNEV